MAEKKQSKLQATKGSNSLDNGNKRLSKNQWRRQKAKLKKTEQHKNEDKQNGDIKTQASTNGNIVEDRKVEILSEDTSEREPLNGSTKLFETAVDIALNDPQFAEFKQIIDKFHTEEAGETVDNSGDIFYSDDEGAGSGSENNQDSHDGQKLSKKKLKVMSKMPLVELKSIAPKPELVEWFDADAPDPILVVEIKAQRGAVPVPDHWQAKREYLSTKRGIKKAPFDLPNYIKDTGIMEMRNALKEDEQTLRQKTRERVQPKMGKLDIDYVKLHNAFFKFQTKPRLYRFGELYYEGKEAEINMDSFRPGKLSARLTEALSIPLNAPPPWLLNMQRYGPPPSYPGLKIPGLNAPIPPGAQWGFQPGGYGRPPLDENGKPLYGDVYGITQAAEKVNLGNPIERTPWGQFFQDESEDESDNGEELEGEEEEEIGEPDFDEEGPEYAEEGPVDIEPKTVESAEFELRKNIIKEQEQFEKPRELFQVLKERTSEKSGFMGHQKVYEIPPSGTRNVSHLFDNENASNINKVDTVQNDSSVNYSSKEEEIKQRSSKFQDDLDELVSIGIFFSFLLRLTNQIA